MADAVDVVAPAARIAAMLVAVCVLVAVSTTEFTSAIVLFLAALIVFVGLMELAGPASVWLRRELTRVPLLLIFLAIAAVVVVTYLRGMPRRITVALAAFLAGLGIFSLKAKPELALAERGQPYAYPPTLVSQPESLHVDSVTLTGGSRDGTAPIVDVSLSHATPSKRYERSWALLTVTFANGDSVGVSLQGRIENPEVRQLLTLPSGLKLRGSPAPDGRPRATLAVRPSVSTYVRLGANTGRRDSVGPDLRDEMPAILKRIRTDSVTAIRVDVMLDRYRQVDFATLPLNGAPPPNEPGRRISFTRREAPAPYAFAVDWSTLGPTRLKVDGSIDDNDFFYSRSYVFVLENADRGEAVLLTQGNVQSSAGAVVLPGIALRSHHYELDGVDGANDRVLDDAWLQRATLRVIRWERDGRLLLSTRYVMPRR